MNKRCSGHKTSSINVYLEVDATQNERNTFGLRSRMKMISDRGAF